MHHSIEHYYGRSRKELSNIVMLKMIAGGLAGAIYFGLSYPFDIVKTIVQINTQRNLGMLEATRLLYQNYGWRVFFRGLTPCLLGALPENSILFLTYEVIISLL